MDNCWKNDGKRMDFFLNKGHLRPLLSVCLVVLPNKVEVLFNSVIIEYQVMLFCCSIFLIYLSLV
jgi:hypothetical protein